MATKSSFLRIVWPAPLHLLYKQNRNIKYFWVAAFIYRRPRHARRTYCHENNPEAVMLYGFRGFDSLYLG